MRKCKYCQAELAENGTFCPSCGRDNAEPIETEETVTTAEETVVEETAAAETAVEETASAGEAEVEVNTAEENTETPKKATPGKIALAVAAVVVLLAALIGMLMMGRNHGDADAPAGDTTAAAEETVVATIPADGNPDDVTCKGSYSVTDEEAVASRDTAVATMGENALTNGQLRIYYRSAMNSFFSSEYGYYMMMYGMLDLSQPLDTQVCALADGLTWQQFFLQTALENWQLSQALANEAQKAGAQMLPEDVEYLQTLQASLEETAKQYNMTLDDLLRNDFGAGTTFEDFHGFQQRYLEGNPYYSQQMEKIVPTQEDLENYFAAHEAEYAADGITKESKFVDVRHILIQVEGGTTDETGATVYTDEEWAACEAEAQAILDTWLAGEKTEDSFAALANEKSEDPGSNTNGGLYEDVYVGQMVEPFETWCFDESRQYGDYGLVKTSYGYHVMFYVGNHPMWTSYAESGWINEQSGNLLAELIAAYPAEIHYENIALGNVPLV